MNTYHLTDAEWGLIQDLLQRLRAGRGRPSIDERATFNGILWRAWNGTPWRDIPSEYGPWWRGKQLVYAWARNGRWTELCESLEEVGHERLAVLLARAVY